MRHKTLLTSAATCLILLISSFNAAAQKSYNINDNITIKESFIEFTKGNTDIAISIPQIKINGEITKSKQTLINNINSDACHAVALGVVSMGTSADSAQISTKIATPQMLEMFTLKIANDVNKHIDGPKSISQLTLYSHWKTYGNEHIISLYQRTFRHAGGAHGLAVISINNYNVHTGKRVDLKKAIIDTSYFMEKVVKYFCKERGLKNGALQIETGLFYELNDLPMPSQVGVTNKGVIIAYQPYEIGPNIFGPIIVTIPFKEIDEDMDAEFQNMVSYKDSKKNKRKNR